MKNFRAADKTHAGGDEKHDINFHWPKRKIIIFQVENYIVTNTAAIIQAKPLKFRYLWAITGTHSWPGVTHLLQIASLFYTELPPHVISFFISLPCMQ